MTTNKTTISSLAEICAQKGITKIVLSPGSRNSPIAIAFNRHPKIQCYVIVDERAAAFFALGMAQQTKKAVAIACTSGSAALNYAPAIVEAFYQRIPLVVLTADRPVEWINQGAGQTIQQRDIFKNYILKSFELTQEAKPKTEDLWFNDRQINEAINLAHFPKKGPVHINIPLREPLYDLVKEAKHIPKVQELVEVENTLVDSVFEKLKTIWEGSKKKLILCGLMEKNEYLNTVLEKLDADPSVTILTETTANLWSKKFNPCIDRLITTIEKEEERKFAPEILVTLGGAIISKKIKALFRKLQPQEHWHFDVSGEEMDTYQSLTKTIRTSPEYFFKKINEANSSVRSNFQKIWNDRNDHTRKRHNQFLKKVKFSDFKAYEIILGNIPSGSNFQMGNSAGVRYVQLFDQRKDLSYNSNRGTSGIDGSTSTAVGAAVAIGKPTTLVCGDLSFFYDVNGLWNPYLPANLRIIIINNSGGGIFRIIPGPSTSDELGEFFEVTQKRTAEPIAKMYNLDYQKANSVKSLEKELSKFYKKGKRTKILEVFTPRKSNDKILESYFEFLKK
ncbi:MAG: 2-succinyl-5-enolpyruvyl-6-hydroxy-3-cyclohexene-1-carboxylic-acid synthase [Saprospiraceae bacterium]